MHKRDDRTNTKMTSRVAAASSERSKVSSLSAQKARVSTQKGNGRIYLKSSPPSRKSGQPSKLARAREQASSVSWFDNDEVFGFGPEDWTCSSQSCAENYLLLCCVVHLLVFGWLNYHNLFIGFPKCESYLLLIYYLLTMQWYLTYSYSYLIVECLMHIYIMKY